MPAGNTIGQGVLAQVRYGDEQATALRPLTQAIGLSYTVSTSRFAAPLALAYTIMRPNVASMQLFYTIAPLVPFAINGDSTIVKPDQMVHSPRPVVARTLIAGPQIQGYKTVTWTYSVLQLAEYNHLISFYNPRNPVVLLTYPDENGVVVQRNATMHPPAYGTQTTVTMTSVSFIFTNIN